MKNILFVSNYQELVEDIGTEFTLNGDNYDYNVTCSNTLEGIDEKVTNLKPDLVVLSVPFMKKRSKWDFKGVPVAYHAVSENQLEEGAKTPYPTVGIMMTCEEALKKLDKEPYFIKKKEEQQEINAKDSGRQKNSQKTNKTETVVRDNRPVKENRKEPAQTKKNTGYQEPVMSVLDDDEYFIDTLDDEQESMPYYGKNKTFERQESEEPELEIQENIPVRKKTPPNSSDTPVVQKKPQEHSVPKNSKATKSVPPQNSQDYIEQEFMKDISRDTAKTKVITVYAAKGGVGKTTISTELAVYLSLVSKGRENLRVCLVDYNIDFGDVKATLDLDSKNTNLTIWAEDVQDRLDHGEAPEDITYTRKQMEKEYLTLYKRSGLYVLPTSSAHEDSMVISTDSLSIILKNIIQNGGFDFVICDTGNNTRDSTMVALQEADITLILMTQSVNTANCDKAFMSTMKQIDFALSSPKLVVNYIMPQKVTNISVQEILEFFPYDCVGKIKFNSDVIKAANLAEPLAFQPDHEFTKQLRSIVSYILQDSDFEVRTKPKKKLFGFIPVRSKK